MMSRIERADPYDLGEEASVPIQRAPVSERLDLVRADISSLDRRLVTLLAERVQLAKRTNGEKDAIGMPAYDPAREAAVVRKAAEDAERMGLDTESVREVFWRIVRMSRDAQGTSA